MTKIEKQMSDIISRRRDSLKLLVENTIGSLSYYGSQAVVAATAIGLSYGAFESILTNPSLDASLATPAVMMVGGIASLASFGLKKITEKIKELTSPLNTGFNKISNERILKNFSDLEDSPRKFSLRERLISNLLKGSSADRLTELTSYLSQSNDKHAPDLNLKIKKTIEARLADQVSMVKNQEKSGTSVTPRQSKINSLAETISISPAAVYAKAFDETLADLSKHNSDNTSSHLDATKALISTFSSNNDDNVELIKKIRIEIGNENFEQFVDSISSLAVEAANELNKSKTTEQEMTQDTTLKFAPI